MDLSQQKLHIIEWALKQDKTGHLQEVIGMIEQLEHETVDGNRVVGYRKGGLKVTGKDFVTSILQAQDDVTKGNHIPLDQIESESEQW